MPTTEQALELLGQNISQVIVGKPKQLKLLLSCWLAGGHVLIEDCPGTGKTMFARSLAKSCEVEFKRVQFTPDLLPSDILGTSVYNQQSQSFDFHQGPIFTTILLADEINRATPRTQSALLEGMAEGQATIDGVTRSLDPLFFVLATQNPVDTLGTFPLPEAQLDRFMMKISMGYPGPIDEAKIVRSQNEKHPIHNINSVWSRETLQALRGLVPQVLVTDEVMEYAVKIVSATRIASDLKLGASPRATLAWVRVSQAMALLEGLEHVRPTHLFQLAKPVLAHRLIVKPEAKLAGLTGEQILEGILESSPSPVSRS